MKRLLFTLFTVISLLTVTNSFAQKASPFTRGSSDLDIGMNFGSNYLFDHSNGKLAIPQFFLDWDYGVTDRIGIGYLGLGAQWGFYGFKDRRLIPANWEYQGYGVAFVTYAIFRATYHFDFYKITREPFFQFFDVYAGPYGGFAIRFKTDEYHYPNGTWGTVNDNTAGGIFGLTIGTRYEFSKKMGVFVEANIEGNSGFNFGLTYLMR